MHLQLHGALDKNKYLDFYNTLTTEYPSKHPAPTKTHNPEKRPSLLVGADVSLDR